LNNFFSAQSPRGCFFRAKHFLRNISYTIFSGYAWLTPSYYPTIKINGLEIKVEHRVYQGKIIMSGIIEYRLFVERNDTVKAAIPAYSKRGYWTGGT